MSAFDTAADAEGEGHVVPVPRVGRTGRRRLTVIGVRGLPGVIGGIETHCELLYPRLAPALPDLETIILVRRAYAAAPWTMIAGVSVRALPALRGSGLETLSHTLVALLYARVVLGSRLVHLHGIGPGFFAPLARLLGMRTVVTHHAADFQRPKWGGPGKLFLQWGEGMAARFADRVICVSEALRRDFLSRHPRAEARAVTIRHGALVDPLEAPACARVLDTLGLVPGGYVLAVGRLDETKRFDDLIAAHAMAGADAPPLVIVGASVDDGSHEATLRAQAGPNVMFTGFRVGAELAALYRGAALFVHASEMEGFGLVVLEAMIAGVPIRVSDIPPHREFGLPDSCYFTVGDLPAIAAAMQTPAPRPAETATYAALLDRYTPAAAVRAHVAVFEDLVRGRAGKGKTPSAAPRRSRIPWLRAVVSGSQG